MKPKYKPGRELMYLKRVRVTVKAWDPGLREYFCHCPAWGEDIYCQEKDLKPIEE
jgi:hypothetical protein